MKKKLAVLLTVAVVICLAVIGSSRSDTVYAGQAQMRFETPQTVYKENEFKVKVILDSDVNLYSVDAFLSYNKDLLEFVPDNEYVTGSDGVLELKEAYEQETTSREYEITFKALDTGVAELAFSDVYLIDYDDLDYITVTPTAAQVEIGINNTIAEDARLTDLLVAPGSLTEAFSPDQLAYEVHVGMDVTEICISAIPMDEESVVDVEMPDTLQPGANEIKVLVTAPSGNMNTYTITVYREEVPDTTETVTSQDNTEAVPSGQEQTQPETTDNTENVTTQENAEEQTTEAATEDSAQDENEPITQETVTE